MSLLILIVPGQNLSHYSPEPRMWGVQSLCLETLLLPPLAILLQFHPREWAHKFPSHVCRVLHPTVSEWRWHRIPRIRCVCGQGDYVSIPVLWPQLLLYSAGWSGGAGCQQHLWSRSEWRWTMAERRSLSACCAAFPHKLIMEGKRQKLMRLILILKNKSLIWLFSGCQTCILTIWCLICEQCCQFLVLLLLRQQIDGQVGPCHHCSVLLLLISQNLLLCLK